MLCSVYVLANHVYFLWLVLVLAPTLEFCGDFTGSPFLGGFVTCFSMAGSQQSVTTQDLLQPLQKSLNPGSSNSNLLPNGFILNASKPYGSGDPSAGQQSNYNFGNGSFELRENFPSKYRSSNISFGAKGQLPHAIPLNKYGHGFVLSC